MSDTAVRMYVRKSGDPVKAVIWTGSNWDAVHEVYPNLGEEYMRDNGCRIGDYVISPRKGRVMFCPPLAFEQRFCIVPDTDTLQGLRDALAAKDRELAAMRCDRDLWQDMHNDDCPNFNRAEAAETALAAAQQQLADAEERGRVKGIREAAECVAAIIRAVAALAGASPSAKDRTTKELCTAAVKWFGTAKANILALIPAPSTQKEQQNGR